MSYNEKVNELKVMESEIIANINSVKEEIQNQESHGINYGTYNGLKNNLSTLEEKLEQVRNELSSFENVGIEVQNELDNEFIDILGMGISLRELAQDEDSYNLISIFIKKLTVAKANEHAAIVMSYKNEIESLEQRMDEFSKIKAEFETVHEENIRLGEEISDLNAKRENAANELDQLKEENEKLKSDNDRLKEDASKLRSQLESRNTNKVTEELSPEMIEKANRIKERRLKIYDVEPVTNSVGAITSFNAKSALDHEPINIPHFAIKSYTILEGEELKRFQEELESEKVAEQTQEPVQLAPSLPLPDAQVPTDSIPGEMAPETKGVTREEFEVLANRVELLEKNMRGVA